MDNFLKLRVKISKNPFELLSQGFIFGKFWILMEVTVPLYKNKQQKTGTCGVRVGFSLFGFYIQLGQFHLLSPK